MPKLDHLRPIAGQRGSFYALATFFVRTIAAEHTPICNHKKKCSALNVCNATNVTQHSTTQGSALHHTEKQHNKHSFRGALAGTHASNLPSRMVAQTNWEARMLQDCKQRAHINVWTHVLPIGLSGGVRPPPKPRWRTEPSCLLLELAILDLGLPPLVLDLALWCTMAEARRDKGGWRWG